MFDLRVLNLVNALKFKIQALRLRQLLVPLSNWIKRIQIFCKNWIFQSFTKELLNVFISGNLVGQKFCRQEIYFFLIFPTKFFYFNFMHLFKAWTFWKFFSFILNFNFSKLNKRLEITFHLPLDRSTSFNGIKWFHFVRSFHFFFKFFCKGFRILRLLCHFFFLCENFFFLSEILWLLS